MRDAQKLPRILLLITRHLSAARPSLLGPLRNQMSTHRKEGGISLIAVQLDLDRQRIRICRGGCVERGSISGISGDGRLVGAVSRRARGTAEHVAHTLIGIEAVAAR